MDRTLAARYFDLEALRRTHPAWRLLRAENAALVLSFLQTAFIGPNRRAVSQLELCALLDDYLFHLRETGAGEEAYPKTAHAYLEDWAADDAGWLRKYYVADSDEPHFDVTPSAESAVSWVAGLETRQFVGTESRLNTIFELLRQLVDGTQTDPDVRAARLQKRRAAIDAEISEIRKGNVSLLDSAQIKDRFMQMEETARQLLGDFRQVEENFRVLDRSARERIATWEGGKGALLQEIFGDRDAIADSDQGKSFRAFWDFLMSPTRQEELSELLRNVISLDGVQELGPDRRLLRIHYDWLDAGEIAQRTIARLSEQLRRLLDDRVLMENRRIVQLIRDIEQNALAVRDAPPREAAFSELDEIAPDVHLPMDRPLFLPPYKVQLGDGAIQDGTVDAPSDALFEQFYVDKARLQAQIREALQLREQISLGDLLRAYPLEHGLAELIAYLTIAANDGGCVIDDSRSEQFEWLDRWGTGRRATMPLVLFTQC
jgi:hypothetical protein